MQAVVFAVGAGTGIQHTPYSWAVPDVRASPARAARPSSRTPRRRGSPRRVGLGFAVVALVGYGAGVDLLGAVATGFALAAAFLNAAFGFCLGCEVYLLLQRAQARTASPPTDHLAHTSDNPPGPSGQRKEHHEPRHRTRERRLGRGAPRRPAASSWSRSTRTPPPTTRATSAGAIKLDWTTDLQDQVRRDFVNKAQFEALLSEKGVANDQTVVLYGGNNNWFAAYAYWYFKLYGHQDVKLLDGGRKKWELDSRELTDEAVTRERTSYTASEQDRSIRAFRDETVAAIGAKNLVDVRSPDEYAGRLLAPAHLPQEQAQRAGHIPTAANVPWSKAANDDGTFRSDDELTQIYTDAGVDWGKDTIAYCRIGERSSHTWFVLRELLGQQNVKNYDGSWTEYGSLVGVPVALGDEKG